LARRRRALLPLNLGMRCYDLQGVADFISYVNCEGLLLSFYTRGTLVFGDGTFWCPVFGFGTLPSHYLLLLSSYVDGACWPSYSAYLAGRPLERGA